MALCRATGACAEEAKHCSWDILSVRRHGLLRNSGVSAEAAGRCSVAAVQASGVRNRGHLLQTKQVCPCGQCCQM